MKVIIEEKTFIKFFKWVILSKTTIRDSKIIENEPVYVPNLQYFKKEFMN